MKQCVICDRFLKNQKELYIKNHYLCDSVCTVYYIHCYDWQNKKVNVDMLNNIRRETIGIDVLMQYEIDKRIDKEDD